MCESQAGVQYEPPVQAPGLLPPGGQGEAPRPRGRDDEAGGGVADELILPHPGRGKIQVSQGQQGEAGTDEATGRWCYKTLQTIKFGTMRVNLTKYEYVTEHYKTLQTIIFFLARSDEPTGSRCYKQTISTRTVFCTNSLFCLNMHRH